MTIKLGMTKLPPQQCLMRPYETHTLCGSKDTYGAFHTNWTGFHSSWKTKLCEVCTLICFTEGIELSFREEDDEESTER